MKAPPESIREYISYAPETGVFLWEKSPHRKIKSGSLAGFADRHGYRRIGFKGKIYSASRLAWWLVHGDVPPEEIDHINRDVTDDRICNLRLASRFGNTRNQKGVTNSSSRYKGVSFHKRAQKWAATITVNRQYTHIGLFVSEDDAAQAYDKSARKYFGKFAFFNFPELLT